MRIATVVLAFSLSACAAPDASREALVSAGYTRISIGGPSLWGCDRNDVYSTEFTADNANGKRVSGVVCCGLLKFCTIKY